jgi:hypothetical protein
MFEDNLILFCTKTIELADSEELILVLERNGIEYKRIKGDLIAGDTIRVKEMMFEDKFGNIEARIAQAQELDEVCVFAYILVGAREI